MKELIELIIKNALPEDADYSISQVEDDTGLTFEINIPEEFRGKIIGKGGNNIKAIRNVMNIIARRENQRVFIKILD